MNRFVEYLLYACADTVLHVENTEMNVMNKALVLIDSWDDKRGQVNMYIFYREIISRKKNKNSEVVEVTIGRS